MTPKAAASLPTRTNRRLQQSRAPMTPKAAASLPTRTNTTLLRCIHMCVCVCVCFGGSAFPHAVYLLLVQVHLANSSSIETAVKREPAGHNNNDASEVCGCAGRRCDGDRIAIFCTPSFVAGLCDKLELPRD
jgi:hypothetical protein